MTHSFESLGLREELLRAVTESGYTEPSAIQQLAIPPILEGVDVLGQAQTGTGKTAAFTLPILHRLEVDYRGIQALILTPTRELALQVSTNVERYGQFMRARVVPIYGGQSYVRQQRQLERGAHVVVGTPGRILDLMEKKMLDLSHVRFMVLDEADEMLKMGFIDDVETILAATPSDRQTCLFSATLPETIRRLAKQYMRNPQHVHVPQSEMTVQTIEQNYVIVHDDSKIAALSRILEVQDIQSALIFTRTRARALEVSEALRQRAYQVDAISGDLSQDARETVLKRFRSGDLPLLVATDVVARGVDIPDVSHVFNFDIPLDDEDYVHRIGRTGRAGRSGIAITFITPGERRKLRYLEQFIGQTLAEMKLPKLEDIREHRNTVFLKKLEALLEADENEMGTEVLNSLADNGYDMVEVAAAAIQLARAVEANRPIDHVKTIREQTGSTGRGDSRSSSSSGRSYGGSSDRRSSYSGESRSYGGSSDRRSSYSNGSSESRPASGTASTGESQGEGDYARTPRSRVAEEGMVRLIMDVGRSDGVRPGDIVGAIANSAGIPGKAIGAIEIRQNETFIDVHDQHVEKVLTKMKRGSMKGKPVKIVRA